MKSQDQVSPPPLPIKINLSKPIGVILIAAFILLPFSHLRWLPDLGITRPISSILFVLAFGFIGLEWLLNGFGSLRWYLINLPGWKFLRYWLVLIALGIISALITLFYGNFFQAANRLLGYLIIFTTLYCSLFALRRYGISPIATWISLGYLPALLYGCLEALVAFKIPWAITAVLFVRQHVIVEVPWSQRLSLFATEASFVSFQLILLIAIMPFLKQRLLRWSNIAIIILSLIFSVSGNVILQVFLYLVLLGFFSLSSRFQLRLSAATAGLVGIAAAIYWLVTPVQVWIKSLLAGVSQFSRFGEMPLSAAIRFSYIKNLIYIMIDTRGVGLGIGQYGQFWKEYYLRHIDYKPLGNEVANALASSEYMRPWSVILGIGVDLGVIGLLLMLAFLYEIWRLLRSSTTHSAHGQAIWVSSVIALVGAYPIVTPHVWIALALLGGLASQQLSLARVNNSQLRPEKE